MHWVDSFFHVSVEILFLIIFGFEFSLFASCECFSYQMVAMVTFQINKDFQAFHCSLFAEWTICTFMVHANTMVSNRIHLHMSERNKQTFIDIGFALLTFTIFHKIPCFDKFPGMGVFFEFWPDPSKTYVGLKIQ